jgi:GNAT superfamily N-acetyltransferase
MSAPFIRRVSHSEILCARNAQQLIDEYAAECSISQIGKIDQQAETYAQLEAAGLLQCFGVFEEYDPGELRGPALPPDFFVQMVGFASVLTSVPPHYGCKVAAVESLFVSRNHRANGTGRALMDAIEDCAAGAGCGAILYSAPAYSRFAKVLAAHPDYVQTSLVFCRSLDIPVLA